MKIKRACALGALTWRVNRSLALGNDPAKNARVQSLHTFKTEFTSTNKLKSMIVEMEGCILAFEYVQEGLLVGVCGGKSGHEIETKTDDLVKANKVKNVDNSGDAGKGDAEGAPSTKGSQSGDKADEEGGDNGEGQEPKWKAIEDKASAMAAHLRKELNGFKMPAGLQGLE